MLDLILEIRQTLRNNRVRTALTGVSVAWGIFVLIVLLGMTQGLINAFDSNVRGQGSNSISVFGGVTSEPWRGYKSGRYIELNEADKDAVANRNARQFASVSTTFAGQSAILSTPKDYMETSYEGCYPSKRKNHALTMLHGRFINQNDLDQTRKVMVLSKLVAETLFADPAMSIGQTVKYNDLIFTIVGVFDSKWERQVYIPYTTARSLAGGSDNVSEIEIELQNVNTQADGDEAEQSARQALAATHLFNPDDQSAIHIWNRFTTHMQMSTGMNILSTTMWVIGILTLLSGIIGVSNIMFVSVKERTHEIGIRRAIGAKPRNILTQILLESVSITTLFGYIGIVLGTAMTELLAYGVGDQEGFKDPGVSLSLCFEVTLLLIICGAIAGISPALKALKIHPVEALRDE